MNKKKNIVLSIIAIALVSWGSITTLRLGSSERKYNQLINDTKQIEVKLNECNTGTEEKDKTIEELKQQIEEKDSKIAEQEEKINTLQSENATLRKK